MNSLNVIVNTLLATTIIWFGSYFYYYGWLIYNAPQPMYSYLFFVAAFSGITIIVWWRGEHLVTARMEQKSHLMLWLLLYAAYGVFAFLRSTQDQMAQQALVDVMKAVVLAGGFALLLRHTSHLSVSEKSFLLLVIFGSIANILDFMHPWVSTAVAPDRVAGRGAGLYMNPNIAGSFIVLSMIAAIRALRPLWRPCLVLITGLGVSVTFSRGAWIMWGFAVVSLTWLGYFSLRYRITATFFGIIVGAGFVLALLFGGVAGLVQEAGIDQYLTHNTAQRLGLGNEQFEDASANSRMALIRRSLHDATNYPFAGNGLGYAEHWQGSGGPHNMFLLFFVEGGIIGLLLYLMMLVVLWSGADRIGKILVTALAINSMFSHHLLKQPGIMLLIGYIASSAAFSEKRGSDIAASRVDEDGRYV